jgi:hypothetical protein
MNGYSRGVKGKGWPLNMSVLLPPLSFFLLRKTRGSADLGYGNTSIPSDHAIILVADKKISVKI